MASLGFAEMGSIVTRGWYRVESGQFVRPDGFAVIDLGNQPATIVRFKDQ